ncbi:MAG: sigma 54-interacting transcriptional regulator [Myxococcota bacterium]
MPDAVLVVEPDRRILETLSKWLSNLGHPIDVATDAGSAREALNRRAHGAVFCASGLEERGGRPLLPQLAKEAVECPVVAVGLPRGSENAQTLIGWRIQECLRLPLDRDECLLVMRRISQERETRNTTLLLEREVRARRMHRPLVAASSAMIRLMEEVEGIAALDTPVQLIGEYGVGKESVARMIHAYGPRRHSAFLHLNATDMDADELDLLLFGNSQEGTRAKRLRGGRLLEKARGGSLYLDAADQLPTTSRALLARRLAPHRHLPGRQHSSGTFDLRLMAASSPETSAPVDDLAELLRGSVLRVPPLRERREDVPLLVDHFFAATQDREHERLPALTGDLLTRFVEYPWPGNVRELENVVARGVMAATARGEIARGIPPECLPHPDSATSRSNSGLALRPARKIFERELILRALAASNGNRTHAARKLEISHRALLYKLKSHKISET